MSNKTAIILGASGSVGQALLTEIVRSCEFSHVIVMARRPLGVNYGATVEEHLLPDMMPANLARAVTEVLSTQASEVVGFSALGVGANTAKLSLQEHRAIDVDLNAAFAMGLKNSGKVKYLAYMSAIGANINAKTTGSGAAGMARYNRVKGEAEAAVQNSGPGVVSIFRPSLIVGSQHTPRVFAALFTLLAPLIPAIYRPIHTREIAQAMVAAATKMPGKSAIYNYPQMKELINSK